MIAAGAIEFHVTITMGERVDSIIAKLMNNVLPINAGF
jgi:hypothetical protein